MNKRTLICLVENKPGVLNRVVSLFRRRNFNMDSLTVGRTDNPDVSRITIVMEGTGQDSSKLVKHLYKLIDVIEVRDVSDAPTVTRDLALIKVNAPDPDSRNALTDVCYRWGARLVDIGPEMSIVEISGSGENIEEFILALQPFGIAELVRSGLVAMGRGKRRMEETAYTSKRKKAVTAPVNGNAS